MKRLESLPPSIGILDAGTVAAVVEQALALIEKQKFNDWKALVSDKLDAISARLDRIVEELHILGLTIKNVWWNQVRPDLEMRRDHIRKLQADERRLGEHIAEIKRVRAQLEAFANS